jgi:hypothetical protein
LYRESGTGPLCAYPSSGQGDGCCRSEWQTNIDKSSWPSSRVAKAAVDAIEKWKWFCSPDETTELVEIHFRPE